MSLIARACGRKRVAAEPAPRRWKTTRWSMILRVRRGDSKVALPALCQAYWEPVHAFMCAIGCKPQEARDVTQGFFAELVRPRFFDAVDPARGKFRNWLCAAATNFYFRQLKWWNAKKRRLPDLAEIEPEQRLALVAPDPLTAERIFERQCAVVLTHRALDRVRRQYAAEGREPLFLQLREILTGEQTATNDAQASQACGRSTGALKQERHRNKLEWKDRYRHCLHQELAAIGVRPEAFGSEIRELRRALS
jgi:hypothetical protein